MVSRWGAAHPRYPCLFVFTLFCLFGFFFEGGREGGREIQTDRDRNKGRWTCVLAPTHPPTHPSTPHAHIVKTHRRILYARALFPLPSLSPPPFPSPLHFPLTQGQRGAGCSLNPPPPLHDHSHPISLLPFTEIFRRENDIFFVCSCALRCSARRAGAERRTTYCELCAGSAYMIFI